MIKNPMVSVIITTYNRAYLILESIKSVQEQSYKNFEIIVVDDGSTDNTSDIIKNVNIKYIKLNKNYGVSFARNVGIKYSRGEFIAFQDSDDQWMPNKLQEEMNLINKSDKNVGIVYTGIIEKIGNRSKYDFPSRLKNKKGKIYNQLLEHRDNIYSGTLLIRKICINKVGGLDNNLKALVDRDLLIRIAKNFLVIGIDKPLIKKKFYNDSITNKRDIYYAKSYQKILRKNFKFIKNDKKIIAENLTIIGYNFLRAGNRKKGIKYISKVIKIHPITPLFLKLLPELVFLIIFGRIPYKKLIGLYNKYR